MVVCSGQYPTPMRHTIFALAILLLAIGQAKGAGSMSYLMLFFY